MYSLKKILVLDTSVFIFDPNCLASKQFQNCEIIIPVQVLEELDKLKSFSTGEAGKNARATIRKLDQLSDGKGLHLGIALPENNSSFKVDCSVYPEIGEDQSYNDNKILSCAINQGGNSTLISRDINLRVRARAAGISAESYDDDKIDSDEFYSGVVTIRDEEIIQEFLEHKSVDGSQLDLYPNECICFTDDENHTVSWGRYTGTTIKPVRRFETFGIMPKNSEQMFAMDMIMDPNLPLVTISGAAGSGKSLISLACGLELVVNRQKYDKLIVMRPIETVGDGVGYLPGTLVEKLDPYFGAIMDSFEVLLTNPNEGGKKRVKNNWRQQLEYLIEHDKISLEPITFMRGRSISNALIIVDEAQNLKPEDAKTILSRLSGNSKIVIEGDFSQIDAKNLDEAKNCLTTTIEAFKVSSLSGHISLKETHRSPLAAEALRLL